MSTKVSVVIPTRNAGPGFRQTLEMIFAQQVSYPFEVIVVDSGSQDETLDICREFPVRLLRISPKSFNHGATRNYAISQAQGEFIVLTVQDAVPADKNWINALIQPLIEDAEVAGVYGRQLPKPDSSYITRKRNELWYKGLNKRITRQIRSEEDFAKLPLEEKLLTIRFDNVNACLRKEVWGKYPFPALSYAEDLAWAFEVLKAGYKLVYEPAAQVWHSHDRGLWYEFKRAYQDGKALVRLLGIFLSKKFIPAFQPMLRLLLEDILWTLNRKKLSEKYLQLPTLSPYVIHRLLDVEYYNIVRQSFDGVSLRRMLGPDSIFAQDQVEWWLDWLLHRVAHEETRQRVLGIQVARVRELIAQLINVRAKAESDDSSRRKREQERRYLLDKLYLEEFLEFSTWQGFWKHFFAWLRSALAKDFAINWVFDLFWHETDAKDCLAQAALDERPSGLRLRTRWKVRDYTYALLSQGEKLVEQPIDRVWEARLYAGVITIGKQLGMAYAAMEQPCLFYRILDRLFSRGI